MKSKLIAVLLITITCVIAYANTFRNEFVWDDKLFIEKNYFISDFSNICTIFQTDYWQASYRSYKALFYRPLITGSFIVDYALWGLKPDGYHLTNLLLHLFTSLIVLALCRYFLSIQGALICALVFAVHPVHTESVSFICGRTDVMAALFLFASLYFFMCCVHSEQRMTKKLFLTTAFSVCFLISLFCKESSISGIAVFMCLWLYTKPKSLIKPASYVELIKLLVPAVIVTLLYFFIRQTFLSSGPVAYYHQPPGGSGWYTFLTMPKIICIYILKLFWPMRLSIDYAPEVVTTPVSLFFLLPAACIVMIIVYAAIRFMKATRSAPALGISIFFLGILPVSNIISIGIFMADRFLYIPSLGFSLICGWIAESVLRQTSCKIRKPFFMYLWLLFFLCFMILTIRRNYDWRNEQRLWLKTARTTPASYRAHGTLAQMLTEKKLFRKALDEAQLAYLYKPDDYRVLGNIGVLYMQLKDYDKAVEFFNKVLALEPRDFRTYANLFTIYADQHKPDEAIKAIDKAIENSPKNLELYSLKAAYYRKLGQINDAISLYTWILSVDPAQMTALRDLSQIYINDVRDYEKAALVLQKIIRLDPANNTARRQLGECMNYISDYNKEK